MHPRSSQQAADPTRADLTPMIDVTFLLLVFFLCSIRFKVLEGRLATWLPKDVGTVCSAQPLRETLDLRIHRTRSQAELGLDDVQRFRAWKEQSSAADEVRLVLNGERLRDLDELRERLVRLRRVIPAPPAPEPDDLPLRVETVGALYVDVVRAIDVALAAGFREIVFRGISDAD